MPFHAAKDLVYTINGGNISSGGYRISKILNNGNKSKGNKQSGGRGNGNDLFKEDSGIPVGLLLLQRLPYNVDDKGEDEFRYEHEHDGDKHNHKGNEMISKLVYANVMADDNGGDDKYDNIELVLMSPSPTTSRSLHESACSGIENPVEISSNEIDDDIYDFLVKNVSNPETMNISSLKPFRRATKKQHFGKHIEKVFQKRKTKSNRNKN